MSRPLAEKIFGVARTDPEGYPCRIGALWSRLFLRRGWAIVFHQTVWIGHASTWRTYLGDTFWRAHEHHHFFQEREVYRSTARYLFAFVWQYVRHRSHGGAPLEREADEAAHRHMASLQTRDRDRLS